MIFEIRACFVFSQVGLKKLTSNLFDKKQDVTPIQLVQEKCGN